MVRWREPTRVSESRVVRQSRRSDPSGPVSTFGRALRELRKEKGVAQEKLARVAVLDRTHISLVERGLRRPAIRSVVLLAEVLDARPSEIVR